MKFIYFLNYSIKIIKMKMKINKKGNPAKKING